MRKIIHCDCDCFYAAIEMRDDPALLGRPVAVGGRAETRGVIATANYEARARGVHSAMSSARALRQCPELTLIFPQFEKYRAASQQILNIYHQYTDLVEPLSLDEAYLDVSDQPHCKGSATLMAQEIRARILKEVGITASAGIAPNKFIAKVASDWNKPNGQFLVQPHEVDAFVAALPVKKIFGVGKVTAQRMQKMGLHTCADLRTWSEAALVAAFGRFGRTLYRLCRGEDTRPVQPARERKSLSVETTFAQDLPDLTACLAALPALITEFERRFARARINVLPKIHKQFVKLRFADFSHTSVECLSKDTNPAIWEELMLTGYTRKNQAVRLLGIGVRFMDAKPTHEIQTTFNF